MEVIMKNGMQGELNFEEKEGALCSGIQPPIYWRRR